MLRSPRQPSFGAMGMVFSAMPETSLPTPRLAHSTRKLGETLQPSSRSNLVRKTLPWWAFTLVAFTDTFKRTALAIEDDSAAFPAVIHVLQCASAGRRWGRFLTCRLVGAAVDLWTQPAHDGHPPMDLALPRYKAEHTYDEPWQLPIDADADPTLLCTGVRFLGEYITFTDASPIEDLDEQYRKPPLEF